MDDARFDAMIQRFGSAVTRRHAMWGALGIATTTRFALVDPDGTWARRKRKKKCKGDKTKCGGTCVSLRSDAKNCGACGRACPDADESCVNGVCSCEGVPDCPAPCTCAAREEGGTACFAAFTTQSCNTDQECGVGSACLANNKCATGCLF